MRYLIFYFFRHRLMFFRPHRQAWGVRLPHCCWHWAQLYSQMIYTQVWGWVIIHTLVLLFASSFTPGRSCPCFASLLSRLLRSGPIPGNLRGLRTPYAYQYLSWHNGVRKPFKLLSPVLVGINCLSLRSVIPAPSKKSHTVLGYRHK